MSTVLHRFTPPTCTLEIKGEKLPLLRRSQVQFELKFKDLLVSTSEPIVIKGDRQDLEQLIKVVDSYLQKLPQTSFKPDIEPRNLAQSELKNIQSNSRSRNGGRGSSPELANHELYFGFLNDDNVERISLTTVQLWDLVAALEAYQEVAALPESKPKAVKVFLLGLIVTITAVGVGVWQIRSRTDSVPDIALSEKEPAAPIAELDEVVPPSTTSAAEQPTPQPKLTEPLTSAKKLPPPPAVDTPKPKPNIPDPADYPLPEVARQSRINIPPKPTGKDRVESLAIAPDREANLQEIPTQELTTIIKSDESQAASSTIEIDPGTNLEPDKSDRSTGEPSQPAEYNPPSQIATSSQPTQIQQITSYFREKWQPPAELKQSLEYRLWLNADGTIERVVPLGKASQLYIDRTKIPLKGEAFVDPKSQSSIVRLLLSPDGGVQVLSE